ncbi:MAG TPA: diguanylate cyclase [Symbiobacteriaceae bacterium]
MVTTEVSHTDESSLVDLAVATLDDLIKSRFPKAIPDSLQAHPGFVRLYEDVKELKEQVWAISNGDLSRSVRQKGFFGGCLRSLQSKLRHLTWQTKMIAAGDFTQRVDFLGEFSEAFNSMTEALAKATAALEESERRYRLLAENVGDMIITVDFQGRVTWVSPSITRLLGYTQEEWIGRTIDELFAANRSYLMRLKDLLSAPRTFNVPPTLEAELTRKNGTRIWTETTIAPLIDSDGKQIGLVGVVRDITDRKRIEDELYRLATTDALTGAFNRRHFWELASREITRSIRYGHPVSLILLDVDHFKTLNDTYGHAVGDLVLRTLVEVGQKNLRATDILARIGGEEFAVLLPGICLADAVRVAERLRRTYEQVKIPLEAGGSISFTISAGAAQKTCSDTTFDDLYRKADMALYEAKNGGRNRTCAYQEAEAMYS